jgi:hypothetical protein
VSGRLGWSQDGDATALQRRAASQLAGRRLHCPHGRGEGYLTATEAGNGFGNRFLWVFVTRSKELPEGGSLQAHELGPILDGFRGAAEHGRSAGRIGFDAAARDAWGCQYSDLSRGRPGLLGSMTTRAEAQVRRIACLYPLADRATVVSFDHLTAAFAVWDYCFGSAAHIFGNSFGDPVADDLLRALKQARDVGLTRTEINVQVYNGNRDSHQITHALTLLSNSGLAECHMDHSTLRPTERWFAVGKATNNTNKTSR